MRLLPIILSTLALLGSAPGMDDRDLPRHIRVIVEYIEAPHETVTKVMVSKHADSGPKLHARMRALVKEKKARIMETVIVAARPGQRARVESIVEFIYPEEYDIELPPSPDGKARELYELQKKSRSLRPECPTAFDTRPVGVTLEIEPNLGPENRLVDLRFHPEVSDRLRLETWVSHKDQWGDASIRRPTFESLRISSGITLIDGTPGFVGLLTPKDEKGGRDTTRKIMLFVRADVIPIEDPDTWKP